MKKFINVLIIICVIIVMFVPMSMPKAKTLADYKRELATMQSKKTENNRLTQETSNKIDAKRNAITNANNTISSNETKVETAKTKVSESKEEIKLKQEELEDVISMVQYSDINSDNVFLGYVFDSGTISEMMERQAIIEQIVDYTQGQLDDLNKLIKKNQDLQVTLAKENVNLTNSITQYEKQVEELEAYIDSLASIGMDYDDQIKMRKAAIKMYTDAGCKDSDDVQDCYYNKKIPSGYFSRPLTKGKITQAWGHNGHAGMDIGGNTKGTAIYAPANGTVVYTVNKSRCGGNIIYIHHTVAGKAYTSEYGHLTAIYVRSGQYVTKGTIIGTVGGDSSTWYYDKCTSGTHLHYSIAYGYYLGGGANGYSSWSKFKSNTKATGVQSITGIKNTKGWSWSTRG